MSVFEKGQINTEISHFTGANYMDMLATDEEFAHAIANVTFEAGSRTDWHAHHFTQVLLVMEGTGWLQVENKPKQKLEPGMSVVIPAGVWHWHGSTNDEKLILIAVGADPSPSQTDWGEKVDETEI